MSNVNTLNLIDFIIDNQQDLDRLVNSINDCPSKELSLSVAKKVFKGRPEVLCDNNLWITYSKFIGSQNCLIVPKYLSVNLPSINNSESLIGEFCNELQRAIQQEGRKSQERQDSQTQQEYIRALQNLGFKLCDDRISIAGKTGQKTKIINWLHGMYSEQLPKGCGYTSNSCLVNQQVLEDNQIDYRTADIWNNKVNKVHEDTIFRLFIRESDISFDIVIKLPLGLEQFDFTSKKAQIDIQTLLGIFTNMDKSKGDTFRCSLIGDISIKLIGYTFGIEDCKYDAVIITLSKDLLKFKNSNFLVSDYIDACMGVSNNFDAFRGDLCLGNKIVIGVSPGKLHSVVLHTTAPNQFNGCFMSGGAGSGKSALLDSLLVQGLALNNGDYGRLPNGTKLNRQGNGSLVMLDAKANEWIKPWKQLLNNMGYILYGFDGCPVNSQLLRYTDRKGNIANVNTNIPEYVLGMCFLNSFRYVIRARYGQIQANNVTEFNSMSQDTLPRILILVDELNTIQDTIGGKDYGQIYKRLFMAKDTRTVSYHWVLAGQNLTKSVVGGQNKTNYPYSIVGKMDADGYEYHKIKLDKSVEEYEAKTSRGSIMSQGMFYFGMSDSTKVVKSMYLPAEQSVRQEVLNKIGAFPGLVEMHQLVRWGLDNTPQLFKDTMIAEKYPNNNFVIAALYIVGAITEQEFENLSNYCLSGGVDTQNQDDYDSQLDIPNQEIYGFDFNSNEPVADSRPLNHSNQRNNTMFNGLDDLDLDGFNVSDTNNVLNDIDYSGFNVDIEPSENNLFNGDGTFSDNIDKRNIKYQDKKVMFENHNKINKGISKILNKSPASIKVYANKLFEDILKTGVKYFNHKTDISILTILQNDLWLNEQYIDGIPDDTELKNIVSMGIINKVLKHLRLIEIDTSIMASFYSELGDNAISEIFKINKQLQQLNIQKSNGEEIEINRDMALNKVQDQESKSRDILNKACNKSQQKNWELNDLTSKIYGFGKVQESFRRASSNIWHSGDGVHPIRAFGWTALGIGTLAVTGAFTGVVRSALLCANGIRNLVSK